MLINHAEDTLIAAIDRLWDTREEWTYPPRAAASTAPTGAASTRRRIVSSASLPSGVSNDGKG